MHSLRSITFSEYHAVAKCGRARQATGDKITRRMRFMCWIPKATDTLS